MPSWIGPWEIVTGGPFSFIAPCVALVFFLITLQRALERCSPENRAMAPGLVWLELIPVLGFIWQIFVAIAVGRSLGSEYRARKIPGPARPGQSLGIASGALNLAGTVLFIVVLILAATNTGVGPYYEEDLLPLYLILGGLLLGLAGLVVWVVYWVKIHDYSSRLQPPMQWMPPYPGVYVPPGDGYCPNCGRYAPGVNYCPRCGACRRPPVSRVGDTRSPRPLYRT